MHQILHPFFIGFAGGIEVELKYSAEVEIDCSPVGSSSTYTNLGVLGTGWWARCPSLIPNDHDQELPSVETRSPASPLLVLCSVLTNVHFFSFPAPATAGGYTAVGLSAATLTDAAVATAAPPDFAASRAANNPAWPAYSAFAAPCTR